MAIKIDFVHRATPNFIRDFSASFPCQQPIINSLRAFLAQTNAHLIVARNEATICGFCYFYELSRFDERKKEILIYEIETIPSCRRQGIGTQLIETVKDYARRQAISKIWVLTNASNAAAQKLYKKCGAKQENPSDPDILFVWKIEQ